MDISYLKSRYSYDPITGHVIAKRLNKPVGVKMGNGYLRTRGSKRHGFSTFAVHHLAWALHHGAWPDKQVDHINGIRTDNRATNLRLATPNENQWNRGPTKNSPTGLKGVYRANNGRWRTQIVVYRKIIHIGVFDTPEEASVAYQRKADEVHGGRTRL